MESAIVKQCDHGCIMALNRNNQVFIFNMGANVLPPRAKIGYINQPNTLIVPIARHCMGTVKPYRFGFFKCHFWMLHASGMYTKGVI